MNIEVELLKLLPPIFNALDGLIENYGVYLYLVFVWLALAVIVWIFNGGLRRRMKGNAATVHSCRHLHDATTNATGTANR